MPKRTKCYPKLTKCYPKRTKCYHVINLRYIRFKKFVFPIFVQSFKMLNIYTFLKVEFFIFSMNLESDIYIPFILYKNLYKNTFNKNILERVVKIKPKKLVF